MEPMANDLGRSGIAVEEESEEKDCRGRQDHYSESGNSNQERNPDHEFSHHQDGHGQRGEGDDTPAEEKNQLETTRAEMCRVSAENQRLQLHLNEMLQDYKTLHTQYLNVVKQGNDKATANAFKRTNNIYRGFQSSADGDSKLVSLSLGIATSSSNDLKKEHEIMDKPSSRSPEKGNVDTDMILVHSEEDDERLKLGLECKFEEAKPGIIIEESTLPNSSPTSSASMDHKEEELGETWTTGKVLKTTRSGDNEVPGQNNNNPVKKARVSVRARCDTPTMNDGCQWRKYGQKIAKGNPCPRGYYRCTIGPSCPVRKQVQRCAEDMSILITTYEGTHNHPLPMSATAMASTTSVAAQMLLSGSSSSSSHQVPLTTAASNLLSYLPSQTLRPVGPKGSPFYFHTASSSGSCPTITLDLTSSNPCSSSSSTHLSTRLNPSTYSTTYSNSILSSSSLMRPFYSTSSLSFDSSSSDTIPTALPITSWGSNGLLSYGTTSSGNYMNKSHQENNNNISSSAYQSYLQRNNISSASGSIALPDPIEATTKAITADPSFQSMLAAALKSIISSGNGTIGHESSDGTQ